MYPNLPLLVRAKNTEHQKRLENMFGKRCTHLSSVIAIVR